MSLVPFCSGQRMQHSCPIRRGGAIRLAGSPHPPVCKRHTLWGNRLSIRVMNAVIADTQTKGGKRLLLICMARYAADDGSRVFPSVESLSVDTQQTRAAVQRQLRSLEKKGLIEAIGRSRHSTVNYRIVVDKLSTGASVVRPNKIVDYGNGILEPKESIRRMPDSSSNTSLNRQKPEEKPHIKTDAGGDYSRQILALLKAKPAYKGMP